MGIAGGIVLRYNNVMSKDTSTQNPKVELADKNWVAKELMDTERRIEKAFHEQTRFLSEKNDALSQKTDRIQDALSQKIDNSVRWMVGLIVTMTIAIIMAVLFK